MPEKAPKLKSAKPVGNYSAFAEIKEIQNLFRLSNWTIVTGATIALIIFLQFYGEDEGSTKKLSSPLVCEDFQLQPDFLSTLQAEISKKISSGENIKNLQGSNYHVKTIINNGKHVIVVVLVDGNYLVKIKHDLNGGFEGAKCLSDQTVPGLFI